MPLPIDHLNNDALSLEARELIHNAALDYANAMIDLHIEYARMGIPGCRQRVKDARGQLNNANAAIDEFVYELVYAHDNALHLAKPIR